MSTYRQVVYMVMDELHLVSDDSFITTDHVIFLADKVRSALLKKMYADIKKSIPESNYQTICLDLEKTQGIKGDDCSTLYLRSKQTIPDVINIATPNISTLDFMGSELTYVSRERIKFVGYNKYLQNIIYCCLGPDNRVYLKSSNPQYYHLEKIKFTGIFEDSAKASELECENDSTKACDILDREFPLEEPLITTLIETVVKELLGVIYKPKDESNNANDDLSDLATFIRQNIKSPLLKNIEGA